jgi:hypothetical protein
MDNCVRYYGWPPDLWRAEAMPVVNAFRSTLGVPPEGSQLAH